MTRGPQPRAPRGAAAATAGSGSFVALGVDVARSYRIALADDEAAVRDTLQRMIQTLGHRPVFAVATGRELVSGCRSDPPDLVLTDIKMPDMDGLEAAAEIYQAAPTPIILVSGYHDQDYIQRAQENHILAYLIKPIGLPELEAAIALAVRRFEEFQALQAETADLRKALSDRKIIERAKGLMMKHLRVDEAEAFRRLQRLASSKNQKIVDVANMILTAAEALNG